MTDRKLMQEYLVAYETGILRVSGHLIPLGGVRGRLQKYVHIWYPTPIGGGRTKVFTQKEYMVKEPANEVAEISASVRARRHAKC